MGGNRRQGGGPVAYSGGPEQFLPLPCMHCQKSTELKVSTSANPTRR